MPAYAELQVTSNFTFLRGGAHPRELALAAAALGQRAFALTDRNSLAGVVRGHAAAKQAGIKFIVGARLDPRDAPSLLVYPTDRAAYGRLSRLLTIGKRRAPKGQCWLDLADILAHADGQIVVALCAQLQRHRGLSPSTPHPNPRPHPARCARKLGWAGEAGRGARGQKSIPSPPALAGGEGQGEGGTQDASRFSAVSDDSGAGFEDFLHHLAEAFPGRAYLAGHCLCRGDDARRLNRLAELAERGGAPLVATNDVHYHAAGRRALQDVLTCIREHCTIDEAGWRLAANAERHLKSPAEMARLFADHPAAIARTVEIAERCNFSLDELRYEYPLELTREGRAPQEELTVLAWDGARRRYPAGVSDKIKAAIEHELQLISQLGYAPYFLTVHDIVRFAREQNILCQGRGSAANSAVCYCLGITAVDPAHHDLLFERFVSAVRNEPPDIDVDFEHERREEVIQYIYGKYGRERAGLAATVICYRARAAIREVGKAMGLSLDTVGVLAEAIWGWSGELLDESQVRELGLDPHERRLRQTLDLARELVGFPRHLSQHVGGFVMTKGPLAELVPIENAAMEDRTVIEWDKDDLDALGILKVDVLALGMLTCIAKGFALIARHYGRALDLASVPPEDPAVYDMLCDADSIGVFQVESRAQMSMLPRLRPRNFYDLVIEVAIVRPGPIQGDMVHPYLRRRGGEEAVTFPSRELAEVLGKTLGVPLFQEQAMRIAIVAAGFAPGEADQLRRAMATFRKVGTIHTFQAKLVEGMVARGYGRDFAKRCFKQIEGFGEYGFPESHAASFALLVYVSAWLKRHYPAVFACALLNSQPMGFYAPAQIVRDARDHGVTVLPVDVNCSEWDCALEPGQGQDDGYALRLGFRQIKGFARGDAERLVKTRGNGYADPLQLWRKSGLGAPALETLARADAFRSLDLDRRQALWAVKGLPVTPLPLFGAMGEEEQGEEPVVDLPDMRIGEHVAEDYRVLRLSLKRHPLALLRAAMDGFGYLPAARLGETANNRRVKVAGLVLVRQRPGTASGVIFATLEDETGVVNVIIWPKTFERYRKTVLTSSLLGVDGQLQREGIVIHVIAERLVDLSPHLRDLAACDGDPAAPPARSVRDPAFSSRDFH
ncbi:MAG: error-prone DNA polymerase [Dongiaceae bacterium]